MKLTAALIFDRLAAYYDIKFAVSNNKGTVVGRPVFFEEGLDAADRVCIVTAPEQLTEALGSGVCIAVGLQPAGGGRRGGDGTDDPAGHGAPRRAFQSPPGNL